LPGSDTATQHLHDRDRLAAAVREAGELALRWFGASPKTWTKGEGDSPVTEADIASNDLLRERLLAAGEGWLSEESENDPARLDARRVWVVDPIDGTRAYIAGREDWSISAALVEAGRPIAAAVFAPVTKELFIAAAGAGATRNGEPIRTSAGVTLEGARVAGPKRLLDRIVASGPVIVAMPRVHSLALRLVRVAHGGLDAAVAGGAGHDWDLAAADLLVHEAGGLLTALDGQSLTYNRPQPVHGILVAAGRGRHSALIDLVRAKTGEVA
jgi:myo-inositol-1(or 4)-monophosphatase